MKQKGQLNLLDEIVVDLFAGGGGWSTGFELATGRVVDIAINHDPDAVLMHKTNHPYTEHFCEDVFEVNPTKVCRGRPVGWVHASPDCKHFSKAKGGKPVDKKIRGLAWVVLRWALEVHPRILSLENVEEFQTWGPLLVVEGGFQPDPAHKGETFHGFVKMLTSGIESNHPAFLEACETLGWDINGPKAKELIAGLGYSVDWRELIAADYGAATTRKRFFLIARRDGRPVWPTATHAPVDSKDVKNKKKKAWRSAAEIINWPLPCPSIFATKGQIKQEYGVSAVRPLADNTLRRTARGLDKFVIKSHEPFIIQINHQGEPFRGQSTTEPIKTITAKNPYGIVVPTFSPYLMSIGQTGFSGDRCRSINQPTPTVVTKAETCFVKPILAPCIMCNNANNIGATVKSPVPTITTGNRNFLTTAALVQYHTEQGENLRGQAVNSTLGTVDTSNRYGLAAASLMKYYGSGMGQKVSEPTHTLTTKDREALSVAFLKVHHAGGYHRKGNSPKAPLNAITASGSLSVNMAHIIKFKGEDLGQHPAAPLQTITTSAGEFATCLTYFIKVENEEKTFYHWPQIRDLLNKYCGYTLGSNEVLIFEIDGLPYFIADIGLRMLTPRELYDAHGFPHDYVIDKSFDGCAYGKSKQVARCGNSVPPPFAIAIVRANAPEWCKGVRISSMQDWNACVTA